MANDDRKLKGRITACFSQARAEGATNIVECISLYGQLMADIDLDLYILEDLSGSFSDDIENLKRCAETQTTKRPFSFQRHF